MRKCETCGKKVTAGMTRDGGDFYTHTGGCFESYMDKVYGRHRWMELGGEADDGYGGYFVRADDAAENDTGITGTGIYYSEWDEDGQ